LELGIPVCIALNMMDVAKSRGIEIDIQRLSEALEVPVIPTIARKVRAKLN
jgi:Fe2+ transport system protein B